MTFLAALLLTGAPAWCPAAQEPDDRALVIRADLVLTGTGESFEGGAVLIRGERILAVGDSVPAPEGAVEVRLSGVLTPGLVDAYTFQGTDGARNEQSAVSTPGLRAIDAFDPADEIWEQMLSQGVTAVQLVPDPAKPQGIPAVAGWSGCVSTGGAEPRVLRERAALCFSLTRFRDTGETLGPTSIAGAADELERFLESGAEPGLAQRRALFFVDEAEGARVAAEMAERAGLPYGWLAYGDPARYGGALRGRPVALPVMSEDAWNLRTIETWKRLRAADSPVCFGSRFGAGDAAALRSTAMAYSRATGDPEAALAAITSRAADFAGLPHSGRLESGARADLVLWTGHPLNATSAVKAVMLSGQTAFTASPERETE